MDNEGNWYRQLAALVLLSASRAAVEFITNPGSRADASEQLKGAFREIDYDAVAKAVSRAIDDLASNSKDRLSEGIDTLRDKGIDVVDEAKTRAEKQLAPKRKGGKFRFLVALTLGALIAYFMFDEQRRDDLLDRLTGASGPIETNGSGYTTFTSTPPPAPATTTPPPSATADAAPTVSDTPASVPADGDAGTGK